MIGFEEWIFRVTKTEDVPADIRAFNFGLFRNSQGSYSTYVIGARRYDPEDDDWACEEDFCPNEKYFDLVEYSGEDCDWRDVQSKLVGTLRQLIASPRFKGCFLAPASAITVGFDDGDLERVL